MLEKIGLPPKPSLRGNNWVVDASHCQGCSSQFTFINRKHHCRRCGGLFCNNCTRERMSLRGQGDSPVRICEPCKKLEEAARLELRHGHKNRAGRGGPRLATMNEDDILNTILANDGKESVLAGQDSTIDALSSVQRSKSSASSSNPQASQNEVGEIIRSFSVDVNHNPFSEIGSATPEELRQQAVDEKKKHKILKAEGKSEEALRAFKRAKELERQAGALELQLRKNKKKALTSITMHDMPKTNLTPQRSKNKDDIGAELRELGWSDADIHNADKKPASVSLEGELSSLLGEVSQKNNTQTGSQDKSQVMVHKKKALAFKREGKLAEAKEELKKAKILEKQIEENELFVEDEDSDEEFSALMRSVNTDKQDVMSTKKMPDLSFNFDNLAGIGDGLDDNFEVNDEDMDDPEIAAALESMGWAEDANHPHDRESLTNKIQSLKREALNEKRAGNTADAMVLLRKAKVLEKESYDSQETNIIETNSKISIDPKMAPKSKLTIQRELLAVKKKALALRREGKLDEADEELKKGKILEQQLEDIDMASKPNVSTKHVDNFVATDVGEEEEEDVTEQDMDDPAYLSLLKNLGWNDENTENVTSKQPVDSSTSQIRKRSKGEIQKELLGLKRKSLALRRQGDTDEAEEVLKIARTLESQLEEMEAPNQESVNKQNKEEVIKISVKEDTEVVHEKRSKGEIQRELLNLKRKSLALRRQGDIDEADEILVTARRLETVLADMEAPNQESIKEQNKDEVIKISVKEDTDVVHEKRSKGEIQRELLNLKRKSLALRRQGDIDEADEILVMARHLETELADMESPNQEISNLNEDQDNVKREEKKNINEPNSLQQEILFHKRKALTLKREGKLAEAKEELRQAKILEKYMETHSDILHDSPEPSTPQVTKTDQTSISPPKLSSRERFKLQQQSLAHKRTSLKLRREGRMDEAEAEFELAKALEAQLDESAAEDSTKSSVDDVGVEDFLDPQLLFALKAIGLDDGGALSAKRIAANVESSSGERIQIEEQIKSEKVNAVRLKRLGKQSEALDALRKAKLLEKKLNSLPS